MHIRNLQVTCVYGRLISKHANREKPRRGRVFRWSMEGKASVAIIVAINRRVHRGKSNGTENQSVLATAVSRKRSMKKDGMITLAFQWTANPETGGTGRVTSREEGLQGKKTRIERKKRKWKRMERKRERVISQISRKAASTSSFRHLCCSNDAHLRPVSIPSRFPSLPPLLLHSRSLFFCVCIVRIIPVLASFTWL